MAIQTINIGTTSNDGTGDSIRVAFDKANQNFTYLNSSLSSLVATSLSIGTGAVPSAIINSSGGIFTGQFQLRKTQYDTPVDIATILNTYDGGIVKGATHFTSTIDSTSVGSGAVIVDAGFTVGQTAWLNQVHVNNLYIEQTVDIQSSQVMTFNNDSQLLYKTSRPLTAVSANVNAFGFNANTHMTLGGDADIAGNVYAGNIIAYTGNLYSTNAAVIYGNVYSGNYNTRGNIFASGPNSNLVVMGQLISAPLGNVQAVQVVSTANAYVKNTVFAGNLNVYGQGSFSNITVVDQPTIYSVPNKQYVNNTILGFAIGLGS